MISVFCTGCCRPYPRGEDCPRCGPVEPPKPRESRARRPVQRACIVCLGGTGGGYRCPEHAAADNVRRREKAKRNGLYSDHWKLVRKARLQLDGGRCVLRVDAGCTGRATTVHLAPELGGNHLLATLSNTASACRHCHGVVDAPRAQGRNPDAGADA